MKAFVWKLIVYERLVQGFVTKTEGHLSSQRKQMDTRKLLIGSIDQGTSSSRFLIYEPTTKTIVANHQVEVKQLFPHVGYVEMDPEEILNSVIDCIECACEKLKRNGQSVSQIKAVGICNQRETTIVWDRTTGKSLYNAVVWLDCRTADIAKDVIARTATKSKNHFADVTGLPIHPYFSALKLKWLIKNVPAVKDALSKGALMFGTVDTWLLYNLTGAHVTDITNASRTLLLNIRTSQWSQELCDFFEVPMNVLPKICSSAEVYATIKKGILKGVPISGCLGDQQAAMFGEHCLQPGNTKCTYGTGTFMLTNIGQDIIISENGLLTTIAYKLGPNAPVCYALEGSGSIGGNAVRFLRDNLKIIKTAPEVEAIAGSVPDTEDVVFVPCFTGLYTPQWDPTARGIICGLTQSTKMGHIGRAVLQAVCCQTGEMIEAVEKDMNRMKKITELKVDGGLTENALFLQMLSDIVELEVIKSTHKEASCWGVGIAAAIGVNLMTFEDFAQRSEQTSTTYKTKMKDEEREKIIRKWQKALNLARGWAD